jgi:hypothetical protein
MLQRALIVFLVVINLGVAAWWWSRAPAAPAPADDLPAGVPRLQLLSEAPARAAMPPLARVAAEPARCISFGPYPNPAALRRAYERVQPQALQARAREVPGTPTAWRVFLPPLASAADARATADRIAAAGFHDLLVLTSGAEANGIALGRFGNEAGARQRQSALQAAGFAAQMAPMDVAMQGWIDVAVDASFDVARVSQDIAAAQARPLDCTGLR